MVINPKHNQVVSSLDHDANNNWREGKYGFEYEKRLKQSTRWII